MSRQLRYRFTMVKKLAKIFMWFLGGVLGLGLIAYAVLFIANLEHREPAAEIAVLKAMQKPALQVTSSSNSYLYMLGLSGPPDIDPMYLGLERYEWMEQARPEFRFEDDPLSDEYDYRRARTNEVSAFAKTCSDSEADCLRLLESDTGIAERWLTDERWLLDRYRTITNMTEFREAFPFEIFAPLPSFNIVLETQRLMIVDAWLSANDGDAEAVRNALERDLIYWRMVIETSDALITKMIATAAIIQHFKFGNIALRRLPKDVAADGIPSSWRTQISDEERSMKRSLAGELIFFDELMQTSIAGYENPIGDWTGMSDSTAWETAAWVVLKPFWQQQDLTNRHARLMLDLGDIYDVPYNEMPAAVEVADQLQRSAYRRFSHLYNFTGDLVMSATEWTFSGYAVRVSDLEGIRRAALLAADLRANGVTKGDIVQHMLISEIVDPYTNEPLTWHDGSDAIVFNGLEQSERSQHKIIF